MMSKKRRNALLAATLVLCAGIAAPTAADAEIARIVEYYHVEFEHYFITQEQAEIVALDAGRFSGWFRTGMTYQFETEPQPGYAPVCRFFSSLGGKATHFFTASAEECDLVKSNPDWTYEGVAFYTLLPDAQGVCPEDTVAIHRVYNNGRGDSPNHAYTPDVFKRNRLWIAGWTMEGVAFCAPVSKADAAAQTRLFAQTTWELPAPALPEIGIFGPIEDRFDASVQLIPYQTLYVLFGLARPPADINSVWNYGTAHFDPWRARFIVTLDFDGWAGPSIVGAAWELDSASGPTTAACSFAVRTNIDARYPGSVHPFQQVLWSSCVPGVAQKL